MELAVCDVFQAALKRHKKENICKTTYEECWLPDEDAQLEQLEWRLVSVEELPVVDVEAVQTTAWVVFLKSWCVTEVGDGSQNDQKMLRSFLAP